TFSEGKAVAPDGYVFSGVAFSPKQVTVADGQDVLVTATNSYTRQVGGFSLRKVFDGVDASAFASGTKFSVSASWKDASGKDVSRAFDLAADGSTVQGPQDLPVGTVVTFSEGKAVAPDGYVFSGVAFSPKQVTVADGQDVLVTATNSYTPKPVVPNTPNKTTKPNGSQLSKTGSAITLVAGAAVALLLGAGVALALSKRKKMD
ncbi:MAG: DUF5979 domain-containing protein, partial [Bifidobacterium sp.]|nr:DUF5979 domain-containing protein [Bifidobacterium sp.]